MQLADIALHCSVTHTK